MLNNMSVPDAPLPHRVVPDAPLPHRVVPDAPLRHRVSVMERYDKERTAAFGALTDAIEAVADKITDGQYKAIYDAAMVIYERSTPPEGVRAMVLDAESLNQIAATTVAAVAAQPLVRRATELVNDRVQRERARAYEREAVNAIRASRSDDLVEAEWGAMWMSEVDEGYGGPWIPRPDGRLVRTGPPMFPRGVQQVVRPPNARDVAAYARMAELVHPAQGEAPPRRLPRAGEFVHYIRNSEALPRLSRALEDADPVPPLTDEDHALPPFYPGEHAEMAPVD